MLKTNDDDKRFLTENIENAEKYINDDNLDDLLLEINDLIYFDGYDENWDITDHGRYIERIYDRVLYDNDEMMKKNE